MLRPLLALLCLGMMPLPAPAQGGLFQEGQRLPALVLPTIDGSETINLAELRGTKLLLIQFASW